MKQKSYLLIGIIFALGILVNSGCVQKELNKIYTPSEVWNNRNSLINKQITIEGLADEYEVKCTQMVCPVRGSQRGCCNSCGGGLGLKDENRVLNIRGESQEKGNYGLYNNKQVGCSGIECNIECYPLESGKKYKIHHAI